MKLQLNKLLHPEKFIQSIKTLRFAAGLGLKESKDICDDLRANHGPIHVMIDENALSEMGLYFDYGNQLKLFKIHICKSTIFMLAISEGSARTHIDNMQQQVEYITEVVGPFADGYIL